MNLPNKRMTTDSRQISASALFNFDFPFLSYKLLPFFLSHHLVTTISSLSLSIPSILCESRGSRCYSSRHKICDLNDALAVHTNVIVCSINNYTETSNVPTRVSQSTTVQISLLPHSSVNSINSDSTTVIGQSLLGHMITDLNDWLRSIRWSKVQKLGLCETRGRRAFVSCVWTESI